MSRNLLSGAVVLALAACSAPARVVSSEADGIHVIRVDLREGAVSTPALVTNAMQEKAGALCPGGWEKVREVTVPRNPPNPLLHHTVAQEWTIRCV